VCRVCDFVSSQVLPVWELSESDPVGEKETCLTRVFNGGISWGLYTTDGVVVVHLGYLFVSDDQELGMTRRSWE